MEASFPFSIGFASILAAQDAAKEASKLADGLYGYGAVGICLVALALWYIVKDKKYEKRLDERMAREAEFQREFAMLAEKYRAAMEKVSSALDMAISLLRNGKKGGGP